MLPLPPSINGLNENVTRAMRMRDQRVAAGANFHGTPMTAIGGPAIDPKWDAFFGALQDKEQAANAAGLGFRTDFRAVGSSPALSGLRSAARPR